jgi:hypothetical protein
MAPRPFDWAKGLVAQYALARDEWAAEWLK